MRLTLALCATAVVLLSPLSAGSLDRSALARKLYQIASSIDGRVGICIQDSAEAVCVRPEDRFSLQSVMKLIVAAAVFDAVDKKGWALDQQVTVHRHDLSLYVQPLAKLVTDKGYTTSIRDLVRRSVVDSDSAATDILVAKLGGPSEVQRFLTRKSIAGIRFDRDEKRLQTEIVCLAWRTEYVDASVLQRAIDAVPKDRRDACFRAYQTDSRDTATPRGMATFLRFLADGKLLSEGSTSSLLDIMRETVTFPDRLKAGVASGWRIGHKTGTSNTWNGVTAATNDVGILTAPDGGSLAIVVFIGDSRATSADRAALMARSAAAAIAHYVPRM